MRLSKYEKEIIILTSEGDDIIKIYTFNSSLKSRLAEYAGKYPQLARQDRWTAERSGLYVLKSSKQFIPKLEKSMFYTVFCK